MWESPIEVIHKGLEMQMEGEILKAVQSYGVNVNKDELIKLLRGDRESYEHGYDDGYDDGFNANKWIPCSERLPEKEGLYLVSIKVKDETDCKILWFSKNFNSFTEYGRSSVAWMPLPEAYKGE